MTFPHQRTAGLALRTLAPLHAFTVPPCRGLDPDAIDLAVVVRRVCRWKEVSGTAILAPRARRKKLGGRIRLVIGRRTPRLDVVVLVLHELVHLALPETENHGALFRRTFAAAAEEAWGIDLADDMDWDGEGEGYDGLQAAIVHRLWRRATWLRAALWWVRVRRRLGLVEPGAGVPVTLAEHMLLGESGGGDS